MALTRSLRLESVSRQDGVRGGAHAAGDAQHRCGQQEGPLPVGGARGGEWIEVPRSSPIGMPSRPMRAGHRVVRPRLHLEPDRQLDEPGPHHPHISVPNGAVMPAATTSTPAGPSFSSLAHIYQGSLGMRTSCIFDSAPGPIRLPPGRAGQVTVLITVSEVTIVLAALDIAADYQRDRAGLYADCTGQTCPACESRLRDAQAYDHLSAQLIQAAQAPSAATARHFGPGPGRRPGGRSVTRQPGDSSPGCRPRLRDRRGRQRLAPRPVPGRRGQLRWRDQANPGSRAQPFATRPPIPRYAGEPEPALARPATRRTRPANSWSPPRRRPFPSRSSTRSWCAPHPVHPQRRVDPAGHNQLQRRHVILHQPARGVGARRPGQVKVINDQYLHPVRRVKVVSQGSDCIGRYLAIEPISWRASSPTHPRLPSGTARKPFWAICSLSGAGLAPRAAVSPVSAGAGDWRGAARRPRAAARTGAGPPHRRRRLYRRPGSGGRIQTMPTPARQASSPA